MIHTGNVFDILPTIESGSVHTCVTSPPYYGLRDYGVDGQIGLEASPDEYVENLVNVFREVRRMLRDDGTLWINLGDSYAGSWGARGRDSHTNAPRPDLVEKYGTASPMRNPSKFGLKSKDLIGIPWRVAFALQSDGWYLRSDIIWSKPNPMPESVRDRPTKSHEYIFLLSKSERYYYDADSIREDAVQSGRIRSDRFGGNKYVEGVKHSDGSIFNGSTKRNKRTVWTVATKPFKGAHFATFPESLVEPCILAGCPEGGTVIDPFFGSGTTGAVAQKWGRNYVGVELNPEYVEIAKSRIEAAVTTKPLGL